MDADVTALSLVCTLAARDGQVAFLCSTIGGTCGGSLGGLELLIRVIDEIFFGRHVGLAERMWLLIVVIRAQGVRKAEEMRRERKDDEGSEQSLRRPGNRTNKGLIKEQWERSLGEDGFKSQE